MSTDNKIKFIGTIVGIVLFISLIAGATYAWNVWNTENTQISGFAECLQVNYTKGQNISNANVLLFDEAKIITDNKITIKEGMAITNVTAEVGPDCPTSGNLTINLTASGLSEAFISGDSVGAFKYVLAKYDPSTYTTITTSALSGVSFDIISQGSVTTTEKMTLGTDALSSSTQGYLIIFYVDGYLANNDAQDTTFSGTIEGLGEQQETKTQNLVTYITSLYTTASKTQVTNNSIVYNYATDVSLMNDRLGGTTSDYDAGNIRYYGLYPNNYIYFNCSDYSNQSLGPCELWRIIGVFDGKVKIMRDSSIGIFSYDNKTSGIGSATHSGGYGSNDWTDSRLMRLLNAGYEDTLMEYDGDVVYGYEGSLYWNSRSGTCYAGASNATKSCDFTSTGLKNDDTKNLISESLWSLRGYNSTSIFSNQIYNYERTTGTVYNSTRPLSWFGKIALPYASDYGYAADFNSCKVNLYNYHNSLCTSVNWMTPIMSNISSARGRFLTQYSSNDCYTWHIETNGQVSTTWGETYVNQNILPTLYLNYNLNIKAGNGTRGEPYQILVE